MNELFLKKCVPCEGGTEPLTAEHIAELLPQVPGWGCEADKKIAREFSFKNFVRAVDFINQVADIAEMEDHHPDILLHNWNRVRLELFTHAIGGLSLNDFIVAAKINIISGSLEQ